MTQRSCPDGPLSETPDGMPPGGSDRSSSEAYEVGYARPPSATRFKPGQSGNPKGRPKAQQRPKDILAKLLATRIFVQDAGRHRSMTLQEVVMRNIVHGAAGRDPKSIQMLLGLIQRYPELDQAAGAPVAPTASVSAADAAIVQAFLADQGVAEAPVQEGAGCGADPGVGDEPQKVDE